MRCFVSMQRVARRRGAQAFPRRAGRVALAGKSVITKRGNNGPPLCAGHGSGRAGPRRAHGGNAIVISIATLVLYARLDAPQVLEHDLRRAILRSVRERPGQRLASLAREMGVDPKTLSYHVRRLARAGLMHRD